MIRQLFLSLLICSAFISGCKKGEEKTSAEEAKKFALAIEKDAAQKKIDFLEKNIFVDALMDRMYTTDEMKNKKISKKGVQAGVAEALAKHNYEKTIFQSMGDKGSFKLVKLYEKEGKARAIFRLFGAGGLNYIDMELVNMDKKTGIADMFLYTTGENISQSMGILIASMFNSKSGSEAEIGAKLAAIRQYNASRDYEGAKRIFDELPEKIKKTKMMAAVHLNILTNLPGEGSTKEMEALEANYADDASFQLMLIDVYFVKNEYDKAMNSVNIMDKLIDRDPFLDYFRGLIYKQKGDLKNAALHFEKASKELPEFPESFIELAVQYAEQGDQENAKKYFTSYKNSKNKDPELVSFYEKEYSYLAD